VFRPRRPASESRVALVLIDEATYDEYNSEPKDFWSPYFGATIDALYQAGARVIGFDILLPMSLQPLIPHHDDVFLKALRQAGAAGRLVMIKQQSGDHVIMPAPDQKAQVGIDNIRSDALQMDPDSVVRRQKLQFETDAGKPELSFAAELAARAGWTPNEAMLRLNFDGGQPFETYSLADIVACANAAQGDFFVRHFKDRIVLISTGVQTDDRHDTSLRLETFPDDPTGERCTPETVTPPKTVALHTTPGVFVHATAIDNLLRNEGLRDLPAPVRVPAVLALAIVGGILGFRRSVIPGVVGYVLLLAGLTVSTILLFQSGVDTPLLEAVLAATLSYVLLLGYRLRITEQARGQIRQMFGYYLAPSVVARLEALGELPERRGERRQMTFFFSDISDFTALTESADPLRLAPMLNGYFDGVCAAIEAEGGIVIEFLGDGVQAMFGAPEDQPDHAARAIAAARTVNAFAEAFRSQGAPQEMHFGHTRLGVHTGPALVGNIGASQRLKYAALGDVVNTTSRLEGLNKYFSTRICLSEETVQESGETDVRRIGDFLFKGKVLPVSVYELLPRGTGDECWVRRYHEAYQRLSDGNPEAERLLTQLASERPEDKVIAFYLQRVRTGALNTIIHMTEK
jgi:class 3 adenylate cyclase/CHASE2 domain-containing sensor protein